MMMNKPPGPPARHAASNRWDFGTYALRSNRLALITRVNQLVGRPSYTVSVLQQEFVDDRMCLEEMMALVREYGFLIAAASRAEAGPDDTP